MSTDEVNPAQLWVVGALRVQPSVVRERRPR